MDFETGAGLLHRLTSYSAGRSWDVPADDPRVRHDLVPNDPGTAPPQVKNYPGGLPVTPLPRELPDSGVPATDVLSGHTPPPQPLDAARLGRVLFLGAGVVRTMTRDGRPMLFRAAGSAGARFPLEAYAVTRGVAGVEDGVHWYDPVAHALVTIGPPAAGGTTTLVVTGVPWRTGWRYAERGFRHLYWDAGTLLAQLEAAAAAYGPRLRTVFPDGPVTSLVGADGVHEFPLALLTLGDGEPAVTPTGPAVAGELPPVEFPLVTAAQRAGDRDQLGAAWPVGDPVAPPSGSGSRVAARGSDPHAAAPGSDPDAAAGSNPHAAAGSDPGTPAPGSDTLDAVIRRRGSQRRMDRTKTVPASTLTWPLAAALRGIDVPHWVAVHGVDGVAPGIYRWPDLEHPIVPGDLRSELERVSLGQSLSAEAAYVVIAAVPGDALDDRTYRTAQLAAGLVEGRLHLAAYAVGAAATGMTFLDAEVPALLHEPGDLVTLLFTCVGVPEYRSKAGGTPGRPVTVRRVLPRLAD